MPVPPQAARERPLGRLTAATGAGALALWGLLAALGGLTGAEPAGAVLPVLLVLLTAGFLLTEAVQLHIEIRRQAMSISLSEIPLVVGLFLVPAPGVLAVRLLAYLVVARRRRTDGSKVAFNVAMQSAEIAAMYLVFRTLAGPRPSELSPSAWSAAYLALLLGTLLAGGLVILAIRRLQGALARSDVLLMVAPLLVSALLNTTIALLVMFVVRNDVRASLLLAVLLGGCVMVYRAYNQLLSRQRSTARLQLLSAAWAQSEDVQQVCEELLVHGAALMRSGHMELRVEDGTGSLQAMYREQDEAPVLAGSTSGTALLARVRESGRTVVLRRSRGARAPGSLRDGVGVPLQHAGTTLGELLVANRLGEIRTFDDRDVQLIELLASQAAVALHNSRLIDRLRHEAGHDSLTGLPNRSAFQDCLRAAIGEHERFSVLLMDLDGFKDVNDTLGHHHGDELLRAVAGRLRASLPSEAVVARLGGDEFAVLAPATGGVTGHEDGHASGFATAALLNAALSSPFLVDGVRLDVRASIGVAVSPHDGMDGPTLLRRADIAMYEAKTAGAPVQAYDAAADRSSHRRLALVAELRAAIDRGELVCHYQPKLELRTGRVSGAEALVRWPHPSGSLMMPDDFIPIAEQTGLIVPLTMLVLRRALEESATWPVRGRALGVAVNVSPRGLLATGFADAVLQVLAETGTAPERLTLEITESSVMADPGRAVRVLAVLHDAGVRLSVDDFGTGYSSLAYLQRLPVHEVKIDKAFVRELAGDGSAIVRAIVDLGHNLGLSVVAEGVEDEHVAHALAGLGCDLAQGYFYSRPVPDPVFRAWCADREPAAALLAPPA